MDGAGSKKRAACICLSNKRYRSCTFRLYRTWNRFWCSADGIVCDGGDGTMAKYERPFCRNLGICINSILFAGIWENFIFDSVYGGDCCQFTD